MAHIEDIRVNGQLTESSTPVVGTLRPVISWDFVEDIAAYGQASYEIKIGTSDTALGTDSFSGNILDVFNLETGNFYEYSHYNLSRGNTYYGQIKATDPDGDSTVWAAFSFSINKLPFVTNYSLSPSLPVATQDIELSYTYNDLDGHDQIGTKIRWYKNNILMSDYDDLCILPGKATSVGDTWSAKITPSDGLEFGPSVTTESVIVQESDASVFSISILPTNANVDDILKAEFSIQDSEYTTNLATIIEWYINGVAVDDSNTEYIRMSLATGDVVKVKITLTDGNNILGEFFSEEISILDSKWHVDNVSVDEMTEIVNLINLTPIIEWDIYKSTAEITDMPNYLRVIITKTPSIEGSIWDTGFTQYTKNSYIIPTGVLSRGQDYYLHIGVSDEEELSKYDYNAVKIETSGSSWSENVDNKIGWTIEFKVSVKEGGTNAPEPTENDPRIYPQMGAYIHDGSYFCSITMSQKEIIFLSDESIVYTLPTSDPDLTTSKTFKISAINQNLKVFINNNLVIDAIGMLTNKSLLKKIEYGDIDGKYTNEGTFRFFRYSTDGAFGFSGSLREENTFYFHSLGQLKEGEVQYILDNYISVLPTDTNKSAKIVQFNENSKEFVLPTVSTNYSPITCIFIDKNRNKYIGTSNGVTAIYGEKHEPDYQFITDSTDVVITAEDFDRITTVSSDKLSLVEPDVVPGWFTIDTTYRTIGVVDKSQIFTTSDPYDPYKYGFYSHAIHYYSQRTHGHAWYDKVSNNKGWQVSFSFQLEKLEQDNYKDENIDHHGFGIYINDGKYQEVIYFYEDNIRLYYANVYVPISTRISRDYKIVVKDQNLLLYQKINSAPIAAYQLIIDGHGMFNTKSSLSGNSRNPKIIFDSFGIYHCVWNDDSGHKNQILYSSFDGNSWSNPETVAESSSFSIKNPSITVDNVGRAWVCYEDISWGQSEISVSVRDSFGWNPKTRITNHRSNKRNPNIACDSENNIYVVWSDDRNGSFNIYSAIRHASIQAWKSSANFEDDMVVMQERDENDEYIQNPINFHNPQLSYIHPKIWIVAEAKDEQSNISVIYRGVYDTTKKYWNSIGSVIVNDDGNFVSLGRSSLCSLPERNSLNPSICSNSSENTIIVVWEDRTDDINQIWGMAFTNDNQILNDATQITNQSVACKNPSVGFASRQCIIAFESANQIYVSNYNSVDNSFHGSGTGGTDVLIDVQNNKSLSHPCLSQFVQSKDTKIVYSFSRDQDGTIESTEFPDYYMIGNVSINCKETNSNGTEISIGTLSDTTVSNIDTKEFAFGDISENVGIRAHWKDIKMYFGYDARPHTVSKFSKSNITNWPDDRVNDIFVDTYGNLIVATFGGLCYHNVFTGQLVQIDGHTDDNECSENNCILKNKLVTSVKWGKNGAWYVGTNDGVYLTKSAGKKWEKFSTENIIVYCIDINNKGQAVCGTSNGIYILEPDVSLPVISINISQQVPLSNNKIQAIAVDERDIIWAGTEAGLIRIENLSNFIVFNKQIGMPSSHITSISIVNKHLRFIGTANGICKMNGTKFYSINTKTHSITNNNISSLKWSSESNSLWVGSLYSLIEITFRDPSYEIIQDEIVQYDMSEISTKLDYDKRNYSILDKDSIQPDVNNPITISPESSTVLINKNPVYFGYSIDSTGGAANFLCDLLINDSVEVKISNRFIDFHDFTQSSIEKQVVGEKRTNIKKLAKTLSKNQLVALSELDKNQILLFAGESRLPYTTVLLDRDLPIGCLQKVDTLTSTTLKFKILAYDKSSGIDGYILSNFSNFTIDGESEQEFLPLPSDGIVTHNISSNFNNVVTSFSFPSTVDSLNREFNVGDGSRFGTWTDISTNTIYLFAGTNNPPTIWKYDPSEEKWTGIQILDDDNNRYITQMYTFNNMLFVSTGTTTTGDKGVLYKTTDGLSFQVASVSVNGTSFTCVSASLDGIIYYGDNSGDLYQYKENTATRIYSDIGDAIYSIDIWKDYIVIGTGNSGRIYLVNKQSDDNIIIYDGTESYISKIHIKDALFSQSPEDTFVYASSGEYTNIYRSNLNDFNFEKSYSSFNKKINRILTVDRSILQESAEETESITQTIAAIGDSLFKHQFPTWEFFYKHDEEINDIIQYGEGTQGIFIISDSKISKWTKETVTKTVYLRLKDKSGNISKSPNSDILCPENEEQDFCCNYAYSLKISDLQNFINESRIININEYGEVYYTYRSPNNKSIYSADEIDQEIGIYISEILNGSNNLVSWKSITWSSETPEGTSIYAQVRHGVTESDLLESEWSPNLSKEDDDLVSLEHITSQYLQFKIALISNTRDISPSLTSVVVRNITTQASHFFTTNFVLPSKPVKGILTSNTYIPVSADIVFGINTKNSVDFSDYQIIEPNRLFTASLSQFGSNLRIGAKLLSPAIPQLKESSNSNDPYDSSTHVCTISFVYTNISGSSNNYHFRIRLFNDIYRTQLIYTFFSGNDQTGWSYGSGDNYFPSNGLQINNSSSKTISFVPSDSIENDQKWYLSIEAYNGDFFETVSDSSSFICNSCNIVNELGLISQYYLTGLPSSVASVPNFSSYTPDYTIIDTSINFGVTNNNWTTTTGQVLSGFVSNFALRMKGKIQAPVDGEYQFQIQSTDGSKLFINTIEVINHDGEHEYTTDTGSISLTEGFHDIEIHYFKGDSDNAGLQLRWKAPNDSSFSVVPEYRLFHATTNEYCDNDNVPKIFNIAIQFECENGEIVRANLN